MPTPKADLSRLNVTQLEILTGRDRRWLLQRFSEVGLAPIETTGRERWYAARSALEAVYRVAGSDDFDVTQERARLAKEQADAQALKNAVTRGELVQGELIEAWLIRLLGAVTQRIRAVAPKAAPEARATATDAEAEALITSFHDEALAEIADAVRDAAGAVARLRSRQADPGGGGNGSGSEAAAEADGERVGGRRAKAEPGEQRGAGAVENEPG